MSTRLGGRHGVRYIPAVDKGLRDTLPNGACWKVSRWWTSRSPCSTVLPRRRPNENAFKMAASMAFRGCHAQAPARAARADDGGRGRDARRLHG